MFGISRAGAVWCPVNPRNEAAENRELLALLDCRCLIFAAAFAPLVAKIAPDLPGLTTLVCLDDAISAVSPSGVAGAVGFGEWLTAVGDGPWQADPVDDVVDDRRDRRHHRQAQGRHAHRAGTSTRWRR